MEPKAEIERIEKSLGRELGVHPVAALFPMLADDELEELAADIKANGLRFPIVRDKEGKTLIDGRNRLKACEIAGVKPTFRNLDGEDPVAFIISANIARRNLNKGQQAILLARIFPEGSRARGKDVATTSAETADVSGRRLRDAREIVRRGADLADQVLAKRMNFDEALEAAQKRRKEAITREEKIERIKREAPELLDLASTSLDEAVKKLEEKKAEAARFNLIRDKEPDLAARVNDAMISVDEALAIYRNREETRFAGTPGSHAST
jgi:ParB-like chromosome segregation protein Spo0J